MTADRRNDVGGKVTITVLTGIVMLLLALFVNAAWSTASEGKSKAFEVSAQVTALTARFDSFQADLTEIKDLLRRGVPGVKVAQ